MGRSIKVSVSGFPCRATLSIFLFGEHTRVKRFGQILGVSCLYRSSSLRIKYLVSLGFLSFEVLCVSCPFSEVILSLISDYFMFTYYQVLEVTPDSDFNHVCSVVCIFHWKDLKTMIVNPIYCNQLKLDAWYCTSFSKTGFLHQFMFRSHLHSILCYKGIYQSKFEHIYRKPLHLCILWCCDN